MSCSAKVYDLVTGKRKCIIIDYNRLVHLYVEDCFEELPRQQSYAIKNQLGHPKLDKFLPPTLVFFMAILVQSRYILGQGIASVAKPQPRPLRSEIHIPLFFKCDVGCLQDV